MQSRKRSLALIVEVKRLVQILLITVVFIVVILNALGGLSTSNRNTLVIITMCVNLLFSFWNILQSTKQFSYSLELIFWFFNFVFFGIAPIIQYLSNWFAWGLNIDEGNMLLCNVLIFIWMVSFKVGSGVRFSFQLDFETNQFQRMTTDGKAMVGLVLQIVLAVFLVLIYGILGLFFRGEVVDTGIDNSSMSLLTFHVLRNAIYFLTIIQFARYKTERIGKLYCVISFTILLFCCSPTGLSRYMAGAFWGGLTLFLFGDRINKWFLMVFVIGILFVFPVLNAFRNATQLFTSQEFLKMAQYYMTDTYTTGNYDAYQMFAGSVLYTKQFGFSHGYQMLGAVLFFIPRTIWPSKPVGSGHMVISSLTHGLFTNVSMPLIGEAYISFGIIGVIVFAFLIGHICSLLDDKYWANKSTLAPINLIYPSSMLYFFFLNRGDMLSGSAYLTAHIIIGILICRLFVLKYLNNE